MYYVGLQNYGGFNHFHPEENKLPIIVYEYIGITRF